jgi:HSP20 family protein
MDQLFADSFFAPTAFENGWKNGTGLQANVLETTESYVVQLALPGIDGSKLHVETTGPELRIAGTYAVDQPEGSTYVLQSLPTGDFTQNLTLPSEIQGDGAEAGYRDGILTITLPKAEHAKVRKIEVKTSV